jgi:diadenylate cyclase
MGTLWDTGLFDLIDVVLVAFILWAGVVWLRRTRARLALLGLAIVGVVYLAARQLGLTLTAWLLQGFFAVFVIVLVVVFQEDLRRLFEQIATWGLRRKPATLAPDVADILVRSIARMAAHRTGALIVVPGREPVERHLDGGIELGARISEPLLLSLFDSSSPGHDGAVIVEGDHATRFAVHLPLSSDQQQLGPGGTRHAAALGLAELCDALCIVVSEERGTVSVAHAGRLRVLREPQALLGEIRRFLDEVAPSEGERSRLRRVAERWREALVAVGLAAGLWALVVPGSEFVEVERPAAVVVQNLPAGFELERVQPESVTVTLSGQRRDLYFADPNSLQVRIDALLVQLGRRTFQISEDQVEHPENLSVVSVEPTSVKLYVRSPDSNEES